MQNSYNGKHPMNHKSHVLPNDEIVNEFAFLGKNFAED